MRVLVVDPNAGFAALVAGELERLGHEVLVCAEGYDAYQSARTFEPDLAVLDVGLQEPDTLALARSLRLVCSEMRLMLIPAGGEEGVLTDSSISIQGVLPRPFFLPELPERIAAAMAAPLGTDAGSGDHETRGCGDGESGEAEEAEAPPEQQGLSRREFRLHQGVVESLMADLAAEVGAEEVLLTSSGGLLTAVGSLDETEIDAISQAVLQGRQASAEVARILGREQVRFEQSTAGGGYILYALSVHDATLALTVKGESQLGLLRHRARAAGERIAALCVPGG